MEAAFGAQIEDLVERNRSLEERNRTLEHTIAKNKKLVDDMAIDANRNKKAIQAEWHEDRAVWREGCNRLLSCHHLAHLRLSAKLASAESALLKEMELVRQEKVARLHRDFQLTMFRIRENELDAKVEELEDALAAAHHGQESQTAELEEQLNSLLEDIDTLNEEKAATEKELLKLRESEARLQVKVESTENKLERMTLQFDGAQTNNAELERKNEELKRANADIKRQLDKWQSLETKGGEEVETLRKQRIDLEVEVKALEARLEKKEGELQKQKNKVDKFKNNVDEFQEYILHQREELKDTQSQLLKAKKQVEQLQTELDAERAARPISPLKRRQASPTGSEDEVANEMADVPPPSPAKSRRSQIPRTRTRGKAKAIEVEATKAKPRSKTADEESSEEEARPAKGKGKEKAIEMFDSDSDDAEKESPRPKPATRGKRKRDDATGGASNKRRAPSEIPEVVERPKPRPRGKPASGGRSGSVQPRGTTVVSDEESDEPAKKKKKRTIGIFPPNSQPTSFNFLPVGGAGGIDIPTVLSPVRESDVVPSRSMAPSRTGSSNSVMGGFGGLGGLLSSFGRKKQ
ncbi:putative glycoside hydrolase family 13 protein [Mycena sanguinolenta]|uniref:Putative glycoside hydrolase family 13 protein n=1 Tax=Mycena sanguinolenta TaxID=230812 RepID=A0A8H6Z9D2_9AGAR|nr:putative glycoside hydrolase family 13 protein [Mycena sanguinolenta]